MANGLDLDLLRTFLALAERGSFSAAAPVVHRSQAAVSQQVRRLEEQVGEALLRRRTREVRLTAAGRRFVPCARRLLALGEEARGMARGAGGPPGRLRVGAMDEVVGHGLMDALAGLRAELPGLAFELRTGSTRALLAALDVSVDLVVGLALPGAAGGRTLLASGLVWVRRGVADGSVPLAVLPEGCVMRSQAVAALDRTGIGWSVAVDAGSVGAVEAAARGGLAVGVLPERLMAGDLPRAEGRLPRLPGVEVRLWHRDPATASLARRVTEGSREAAARAGK